MMPETFPADALLPGLLAAAGGLIAYALLASRRERCPRCGTPVLRGDGFARGEHYCLTCRRRGED